MSNESPHEGFRDELAAAVAGPSLPAHFYFHVPFCRSKCAYCDFSSVADASPEVVEAVFEGMRSQLIRWSRAGLPGVIETVYFGGGTPSLHAEKVVELLATLVKLLPLRSGAEVTVEANPESIGSAETEAFAAAGVTRLSLGVQSFDDATLSLLGRCHDSERARQACSDVVRSKVDLSVDLICGAPSPGGDVEAAWESTVSQALASGASHMSIYPLQLEPGTPLASEVDSGKLGVTGDDLVVDMLLAAARWLEGDGFARYEVANYARPGHESRHNSAYWRGRSYAGIGPGASGMLDTSTAAHMGLLPPERRDDVARLRYSEEPDIGRWLGGGRGEVELLDREQADKEDAMLGLRMVSGIAESLAERVGIGDVLSHLESDGLVVHADGRWRTTERGWLLGNEVFGRVWCGE